jgi:hypothetical protein
MQAGHVFGKYLAEVFAGCVFGSTFAGTLAFITAKHPEFSFSPMKVRKKPKNGFPVATFITGAGWLHFVNNLQQTLPTPV